MSWAIAVAARTVNPDVPRFRNDAQMKVFVLDFTDASRVRAALGARGDIAVPARRPYDLDTLTATFRGVDVVSHLAGVVAAVREEDFYTANVDATWIVARAAHDAGKRLVHISSLAAAGPASASAPRSESDPPAPITAYGRSKRERGGSGEIVFVGHLQPVTPSDLLEAIRAAINPSARILRLPRALGSRGRERRRLGRGSGGQTGDDQQPSTHRALLAPVRRRVDRMREQLGVVARVDLREGIARTVASL